MALPGYKEIIDLLKKGATLEAQEKIMELREASISLQEENFNLREELRVLKEQCVLKESLDFDGNVYWKMSNGKREGPFCPACHDSDSKQIRLHGLTPRQGKTSKWNCKICKNYYK